MNLQSLDLLTMELNVDPWRARVGEWKSKWQEVGRPWQLPLAIYKQVVILTEMPPLLYND